MNKLTKLTLVLALFTSLVAKAEEAVLEQAQEEIQAEEQVEAINHFESIPDYQAADEANLDSEATATEETILDQAVSSESSQEAEDL